MLSRLLALTLLAMSPAFTPAFAETARLTVKEVAGEVTVTAGGLTKKAVAGFTFSAPAQVRTGRDGSVLLADSATTLKVSPSTIIDIPVSAQPSGMLDRILQRSGSVLYNVSSRNGRPFAVETTLLTSVVKGTLFSINVQEQSATVALLEGSLDVSAPGLNERVLLVPGDAARRAAGEPKISVERQASAAIQRAPARGVRNPSLPDGLVENGGIDRASDDLARVTAAIGLAPPSAAAAVVPVPDVTPPTAGPPPSPPTTDGGSSAPPASSGSAPDVTTPPGTPPVTAPDTTPPATTPPVTTPPVTPPTTTPPLVTPPSDDDDGSSGKGSRKGRGRGHEQGHGTGNDDRDPD
jgi:hypothetical protein